MAKSRPSCCPAFPETGYFQSFLHCFTTPTFSSLLYFCATVNSHFIIFRPRIQPPLLWVNGVLQKKPSPDSKFERFPIVGYIIFTFSQNLMQHRSGLDIDVWLRCRQSPCKGIPIRYGPYTSFGVCTVPLPSGFGLGFA